MFFKAAKSGDFAVDKDAQAKVTEDLDKFIGSGGGLMIFPEGQLNSTPRRLQQFRRGTSSRSRSSTSVSTARSLADDTIFSSSPVCSNLRRVPGAFALPIKHGRPIYAVRYRTR